MNHLSEFFRLLLIIGNFSAKLKFQKRFALKMLEPLCEGLSDVEKQRIYKYGLYVPVFIGESYSVLRGNKLSENERIAITCLGCMTGLFDDLFDENNYSDSFIRNLLENPVKNDSNSLNINVLIDLYYLFLKNTPHSVSAKVQMLKIFDAQAASRNQLSNPTLTRVALRTITYNKGGFTMQLYRRAFEGEISENEDELYFKLGAIGQLENDIFDVYTDLQAGIKTLVNSTRNIKTIKSAYRNLHREIWKEIDKTNYINADKEAFKRIVSLIIARGFVALKQLKSVSKKTKGIFKPLEYTRSELICDMEKPLNRVKLLYYAVSCIKK